MSKRNQQVQQTTAPAKEEQQQVASVGIEGSAGEEVTATNEERPDDAAPGEQIDGQGLDPAISNRDPESGASEMVESASRVIRVFLLDDHEVVRRGVRDLLELEDDIEVVEARVLSDNVYGKCGEVREFPATLVEAIAAAGYVDPHPNAVRSARDKGED